MGIRILSLCVLMALKVLIMIGIFSTTGNVGLKILGTLGLSLLFVASSITIFLRWVSTDESTSVMFTRGGAIKRVEFSKIGHYLDENFNLVPDPDYKYTFWGSEWLGNLLGGLRFYVWYFEEIYTYDWVWQKSVGKEIINRHEEGEYLTLVGYDYPYGMAMGDGIVTSDNIPVDVDVVLTSQLTNPYKALFNVKWFELLINGVRPYVKEYINSCTYEKLVVLAAVDVETDELFKNLLDRKADPEGRNIIQILKDDYGIHLRRVGFINTKLAPEHQKLTLQKKQAEMDAIRDETKRLGSTTKPFIAMLAAELGATTTGEVAEIRVQYNNDPVAFELKHAELIKRSKEFIQRQVDADAGALKSFHFSGGSPGMELITLLGEALRGGGSNGGKTSDGATGGGKSRTKKSAEDELDEFLE